MRDKSQRICENHVEDGLAIMTVFNDVLSSGDRRRNRSHQNANSTRTSEVWSDKSDSTSTHSLSHSLTVERIRWRKHSKVLAASLVPAASKSTKHSPESLSISSLGYHRRYRRIRPPFRPPFRYFFFTTLQIISSAANRELGAMTDYFQHEADGCTFQWRCSSSMLNVQYLPLCRLSLATGSNYCYQQQMEMELEMWYISIQFSR